MWISILWGMLQFILFKLSANNDYDKLLTVCEWNDLHILKTSLSYEIFKAPALLVSLGGLLGWQAFVWLHDAYLKERSNCLSLCWESGLKTVSPLFPDMDLHVLTCGLRPAPAHTHCLGLELTGVLWFTSLLKLVCSAPIMISLCPPTSLLLWLQGPLCLTSVSKSSMFWNWVTKAISDTHMQSS